MSFVGGRSTVSITWMTPFEAEMSALATVAVSLIITFSPVTEIFSDAPLTVLASDSFTTSAAITFPRDNMIGQHRGKLILVLGL